MSKHNPLETLILNEIKKITDAGWLGPDDFESIDVLSSAAQRIGSVREITNVWLDSICLQIEKSVKDGDMVAVDVLSSAYVRVASVS